MESIEIELTDEQKILIFDEISVTGESINQFFNRIITSELLRLTNNELDSITKTNIALREQIKLLNQGD